MRAPIESKGIYLSVAGKSGMNEIVSEVKSRSGHMEDGQGGQG